MYVMFGWNFEAKCIDCMVHTIRGMGFGFLCHQHLPEIKLSLIENQQVHPLILVRYGTWDMESFCRGWSRT